MQKTKPPPSQQSQPLPPFRRKDVPITCRFLGQIYHPSRFLCKVSDSSGKTPDHPYSIFSTRQASKPYPTIKSLELSNLTLKEQPTTCLAILPFHSLTSIILPSNFVDQMLHLFQEVHLNVENNYQQFCEMFDQSLI
jgi:hypothetical protein